MSQSQVQIHRDVRITTHATNSDQEKTPQRHIMPHFNAIYNSLFYPRWNKCILENTLVSQIRTVVLI